MIPFLIESVTVGSSVTMAVMTANTGGHPINWQIKAVKNTATAVFTIRFPGKRNFFLTSHSYLYRIITNLKDRK